MRAPSLAVIVAALFGVTLLVAVLLGARAPSAPATRPVVAAASSVSGNGFTLTSTSIETPMDEAQLPPGPNVDLVNQRCLSCHSASMILTQPKLKPEQWTTIVEKMRDAYHAPIAPGEVPAIVTYLSARQTAGANVPAS